MINRSQLALQLRDLDDLLEALERMNLDEETALPGRLTQLVHELGLAGGDDLRPPALLARVLDKQQQVRLRLSTLRRQGTP